MSEVTVIRAEPRDASRLAPLFDAYRGFYGATADLPGAERFLRQRLESGESVLLYAEQAGEALGFVQLYPSFSSVRMRRTFILNDLFVVSGTRRCGIGRRLLREAALMARQAGAAWLQLETAKSNHTARALYLSEGYRLEQAFEQYSLEV